MSVPNRPSIGGLNGKINQGIDNLQQKIGWSPNYGSSNDLQSEIDRLWSRIRAIEARGTPARGLKGDRGERGPVGGPDPQTKYDIAKIRAEIFALDKANKVEHGKLWGMITALQKLFGGFSLALPGLIKSIILSLLLSGVLNAAISAAVALLGKSDLSKIEKIARDALSTAKKAVDDARGAATIAVKAEGKADTAINLAKRIESELNLVVKDALRAMQRLEAFIKNEIAFLTKSTLDALLRLQNRLGNLENIVTGLQNLVSSLQQQLTILANSVQQQINQLNTTLTTKINAIKTDLDGKLKQLTTTLNNIKADVFGELAKLKPLLDKIPKMLADIAKFAIEVGLIWAAINGIKALLGRFNPMLTINNFYNNVTNRYSTTNVTNVTNVAPDLSLLRQIDATTRTNLGITVFIQGTVNTINQKMGGLIENGGLSGWMLRFTRHQVLDRAINILTLAATLHNATQLSSNIAATLIQAMQNVLDLFGLKDSEDQSYNLSDLIGRSINGFLESILGAENLAGIKKEWNKYNRIYQSSANLLSSMLNMADTTLQALQIVAGQTSKIGNALKDAGEVMGNAYGWFNPTPNFSNPILTKLNNLEETASIIENVSQQPLSVKSSKEELEASSAALFDSLEQKDDAPQGKEIPEAKKIKDADDLAKVVSEGAIMSESDLEADL
ncbi:hypothetical protein FJR38_26925 [Anabaena sp. UHCC 0253]|uniref:hypothetical protein n=1 Tax=Anabaena sp. UHCC 0253 TaxID=2590019 RepID=UPI0014487288|nr:hypothetical protein [Anabaena sp. UHCC 0253]MTJ56024.1 hypothetical protein [Anabaena sp. UHCC 0253]